MSKDFIPKRDGDLDAYEENYLKKLDVYAETLGLDPEEITETKNIVNEHRNSFASMNSKRSQSMAANERNRITKEKAIDELRRMASIIKAAKKYTREIGDDIKIIRTDEPQINHGNLKPALSANFDGHQVIIKFRKKGTDGIKLFSKRGSENDFTFLAVSTESTYNDTRENLDATKPEHREYYAFYLENYIEIGQQSDVLKIVVP